MNNPFEGFYCMDKKEQMLEAIRTGNMSVEDLVDRIIALEETVEVHDNLDDYIVCLQYFVGLSLSSYCNGFFSKDYDLHNYVIQSISFSGHVFEPATHIVIFDEETDKILEETIHYSFFDMLEMIGQWTSCRHPKLDSFR